MSVRLVALTAPVIPGVSTAEDLMVYAARVSNPSNQLNVETGGKLLKYCYEKGHFSVFETCHAVIEIETSRAIAAQILRHRSFSFQEFSQRYADAPADMEYVQARRQAVKNRQSSTDDLDEQTRNWFLCAQADVHDKARDLYEAAIIRGVAREQARLLLPLGTTTRLYMSGSIRSWLHYIQLRCAPDTQAEHRIIAEGCRDLLAAQLPILSEALGWTAND